VSAQWTGPAVDVAELWRYRALRLKRLSRLLLVLAVSVGIGVLLWTALAAGEHRADSWCRAHPEQARTASTCAGAF
jgi:hypothetical protein